MIKAAYSKLVTWDWIELEKQEERCSNRKGMHNRAKCSTQKVGHLGPGKIEKGKRNSVQTLMLKCKKRHSDTMPPGTIYSKLKLWHCNVCNSW